MASVGRPTYQMQDGFVPDVLRDPYIRVALPPALPRVRMPPNPDDDSPTPPGSPISIHPSQGGLQTGSIPPTRRLTDEFAMPFLADEDLHLPPIHEDPWGPRSIVQNPGHYIDPNFNQILEQRPDHELETAEMLYYLRLGGDPHWTSPPVFQGVSAFPRGLRDIPWNTFDWQQSNMVSPLSERIIDQFAPLMLYDPPRQRGQRKPWAQPRHWRRKRYRAQTSPLRHNSQTARDAANKIEAKTKTEDDGEGREEIKPDWRIPVQRRVRSQSFSAVEDSVGAASSGNVDDEWEWEALSAGS